MNEKVSIILPIYNVEKYLPQCLDSIQAQTHTNWEAILVDDGSKDASGSICDSYAAHDPRFRVIHQDNAGAANAKNTGLDMACGDYVAFVDSDDYVEHDWLEVLIDAAKKYQADVVEFCFDKVYWNTAEPVPFSGDLWREFSAEIYLAQYLENWQCSLFCNKLFRRDLVQAVRFRKERRCIDDEFFTYKAVTDAKKILRVGNVLYHYRQRRSSAVQKPENRLQITRDALEILRERYKWISGRFPNLRGIYLAHDIDILYYIAGFPHDRHTVSTFRKLTRVYLKEALLIRADLRLIKNALKLQLISTECLLNKPSWVGQNDEAPERYFD